jgi:hypothetical protein
VNGEFADAPEGDSSTGEASVSSSIEHLVADQIGEERPLPRRAEQTPPDIAAVRSKMTELAQQSRTLIRQRPVVTLLAAAAGGHLVGRLVSRGMR